MNNQAICESSLVNVATPECCQPDLAPTSLTGRIDSQFVWKGVRWIILSGGSFVLNIGTTVFMHEVVGATKEAAFATAIGVVFVVNFFACRFFVFGASNSDAVSQVAKFAATSVAFRSTEYGLFLLANGLLRFDYRLTIFVILCGSFIGKFFFYNLYVFNSRTNRQNASDLGLIDDQASVQVL